MYGSAYHIMVYSFPKDFEYKERRVNLREKYKH